MNPIRYREDIRPLSEFRANTAAFIEQIRTTRRPIVLTQHGRGAAVLVSIDEYEQMVERLALLEDVRRAEEQIARGEGIDHETAKQALLDRFAR
ncbi:type II toxin-antitoxin system Phd/YefM family antitoxin [Longimicrobium terrae]|uniref:Antitoxin n=1 Tax=Longimicrobium terrae TaxID=1639882 RepID=A0A841GXB9_9BACT|nr:type II toxin-antitoxin system Phd/YefM family antitoxin [Longimicrobium terrae]MBB4635482.1 prevent-host-death family protein [Longimicrobium terrae]MBB6069876.1 prevent-host-death family protein [Longimicrobium terrae]NNC32791.1 type II toxin-antitoxin system Phd/YefM family antitoxin [Longimicrobium terrae]